MTPMLCRAPSWPQPGAGAAGRSGLPVRRHSPNARVGSFVDDSLITALLDDTAFADRNRAYFLYALLVLELWLEQESNDVING